MADFFGSILDSVRQGGDDVDSFFGSAIGLAVTKGYQGGVTREQNKPVPADMGFYSGVKYSPSGDGTRPAQAADFSQVEYEWFRRMQKFAGLSDNVQATAVKLGSK